LAGSVSARLRWRSFGDGGRRSAGVGRPRLLHPRTAETAYGGPEHRQGPQARRARPGTPPMGKAPWCL